jgi:hypothetical protein
MNGPAASLNAMEEPPITPPFIKEKPV